MNDRFDSLIKQVRQLEQELARRTQEKEAEFCYKVQGTGLQFTEKAEAGHRQLASRLHRYLRNSRFLVLLTTPFIWMCLIPILLVDLIGSLYQAICFPVYGIPKVDRREYIAFDRHHLAYLNTIEKLNCEYCAYANGILAYFTEIAARTEQHWCPIKHARCVNCIHSRYKYFFDYGDAPQYRERFEEVRRSFRDIESHKAETKTT